MLLVLRCVLLLLLLLLLLSAFVLAFLLELCAMSRQVLLPLQHAHAEHHSSCSSCCCSRVHKAQEVYGAHWGDDRSVTVIYISLKIYLAAAGSVLATSHVRSA
jgi:hypothetical protein